MTQVTVSILITLVAIVNTLYGQPFQLDHDAFPIGFMMVPPAQLEVARDIGGPGCYVHDYSMGIDTTDERLTYDQAYLDRSHELGLKVMYNLRGRKWLFESDGIENMLKLVKQFKDHPALGFWYLYDEPEAKKIAPETILPFYWAIKRETPDIPVAMAHCMKPTWQNYINAEDITMIDNYPVTCREFPYNEMQSMVNFTEQALALGNPVMPIHQCFNRAQFAKGPTFLDCPSKELRVPNLAELRFSAFCSIAQGTRGIFWYSFFRGLRGDKQWLNTDFKAVVQELRQFEKITAPTHQSVINTWAPDIDCHLAYWLREDGNYLLLVNAWPVQRLINRWMENQITQAELIPWGNTRHTPATLTDGKLIVEVEPWEVMIWQMNIQE